MCDWRTIWEREIGPLRIAQKGYGIDYYWRGKWFLVSALKWMGILIGYDGDRRKHLIFDICCGVQWDGRTVIKFPEQFKRWFW